MNQEQAQEATRVALAQALVYKRSEIIYQLQAVGVLIDSNIDNDALNVATLKAIAESPRFRQNLIPILSEVTQVSSINKPAETTLGWGVDDPAINTTPAPAPTGTTGGTSWYSGLLSSGTISTVFNSGLGILSTKLASDASKDSELRAIELERERTRQAELQAQIAATNAKAGVNAAPAMSTGAKIAIGVGAAVILGGVIYMIVKKKN